MSAACLCQEILWRFCHEHVIQKMKELSKNVLKVKKCLSLQSR